MTCHIFYVLMCLWWIKGFPHLFCFQKLSFALFFFDATGKFAPATVRFAISIVLPHKGVRELIDIPLYRGQGFLQTFRFGEPCPYYQRPSKFADNDQCAQKQSPCRGEALALVSVVTQHAGFHDMRIMKICSDNAYSVAKSAEYIHKRATIGRKA